MGNKILLTLLAATLFTVTARAQDFEASVRIYPSSWYNGYFEPDLDGAGASFAWNPILGNRLRFSLSSEFNVLRARNEFLAGLGVRYELLNRNRLSLSTGASLLGGFLLYNPLLAEIGSEANLRLNYRITPKSAIFLTVGARYVACPGYRDYGIWQFNSWPISIGIEF